MKLTHDQKSDALCAALLALNKRCFSGVELPPDDKFISYFWEKDIFINDLANPVAFAIIDDRGGPYIIIIAVEARMREFGIGTTLLCDIKEHYALGGKPHVSLTCKVDNWKAQRVYLKNGYRFVRVMPHYYGSDDGIFMRKELRES